MYGNENTATTAGQDRESTPIESAAGGLSYEQANTRDLLDRLEVRLQGILTPTPPTTCAEKAINAVPVARSPMVQAFSGAAQLQLGFNERLRTLLERIEL